MNQFSGWRRFVNFFRFCWAGALRPAVVVTVGLILTGAAWFGAVQNWDEHMALIAAAPLLAETNRAWLILAAGLLMTAIIASSLSMVARRRRRLEGAIGKRRTGGVLRENDIASQRQTAAELSFAKTILTAAMEGSPDGILVVDEHSQIISYNQSFIDLWQIPPDVVATGADQPMLQVATTRLKDPDAFLARVNYLYEHPQVSDYDTVELKDGRVFDRHTTGLYDADHKYLGRIWFFRDVTERKRAERALQGTLQRAQVQLQAVGQVSRAEALITGDVEQLAREITELAAKTSGCERVNIWLFNDAQTELRCIDLYEATPARHSAGMVLREEEYRHEIEILKSSRYVNADDALTDPRTTGYVETYLKPLRITSMLDAAIQSGGRTFGLLCFEYVDKPHHWDQDEIAFACQLADKLGIAIVSRMHREAEERLRASEAALSEAQAVAHVGSWELDRANNTLTWSSETCRIFGVDPATFVPSCDDFLNRIHPNDRPAVDAAHAESLSKRQSYAIDHRIRLDDGSIKFVHERVQTFYDSEGRPLRSLGTVQDITERKHADRALTESEVKFRTILDATADGVLVADLESQQIVLGNRAICDMLGYSAEEITALRVEDVHPSDALPQVQRELGCLVNGERNTANDLPVVRKDGSIFMASITGSLMQLAGRDCLVGIFHDVTERKHMEDAIRQNEEKYRLLVESTTDYIWQCDENAMFTYASPRIKNMLGWNPEDVIGKKTAFDLMPPEEAERVEKWFGPIVAQKLPFALLEQAMLHKDGHIVHVETSAIPIIDENGELKGYRGIDRDVTERKRAALALQQRDALLHAVAVSATEFVTAPSLDEAIPKALELVSKTMQIDRMTVLARPASAILPILRYAWNGPEVKVRLDAAFFERPDLMTPEIEAWQAPLSEGKAVSTNVRAANGQVKTMLEGLGIKTILLVPILIDGKYWGQIGFDSCKMEREWQPYEIEIVRALADLIGNAIRREQYVAELANANRIVQDTPTILYRLSGEPSLPLIYISNNIRLFGYEAADLIASPHAYKGMIHPDDEAKVREVLAAIPENDSEPATIEFRLRTRDGNYRWIENRYTPVHDDDRRLVEVEGILIDITERRAAEEKIAFLARTDALTGLANRSTFIERLRQVFASARRGAPGFAILYLDLDRFKDINDTLGHPLGDALLRAVAERLKSNIRELDLAARFGGDEFAVLQADLGDSSDSGALATKICAALAEPYRIGGNELYITASVGISTYSFDIEKPDEMLAQADLALYRAKEEGRNQYRFHSEELDRQVRERVAIADELRVALARNEFELYYQPQVDLSSGQIVGMEALLRWIHPTRGLLGPAAFIPVAEKTGTMIAIGQWVLENACRQMARWREAGIAPPTLAVNISLTQLKAANDFVQLVADTLAKWGVAPAELELDVTESILAHTTLAQSDVLDRLQNLGIKIAIDDFGTKYSSLDYLRTYHVSRLKIPRPMIRSAAQDPKSASMVRAIVSIARELNIDVIAQGVATEEQWSFLTKTSTATKVQGFYYSEPVPAERADKLLQRGRIGPVVDEPVVRAIASG